MTEGEKTRIKNKIVKIKKALTADKKHWGGEYHDGSGLRYLQPALYIQLHDFTGALRNFNWFDKNFPDDCCSPQFYFEYALTLFKTKRIEKAEKKIIESLQCNHYMVNYFLDHNSLNGLDQSQWEIKSLVQYFPYKKEDPIVEGFTAWLTDISKSKKFIKAKKSIIERS
ncbi:tetratricopeptide repeat protein [Crocinitomix catalasitica]|uniref:tetratricopeptide repeat protein n=1 Tax=Crocinitomix catalasitica TaxID=184607 RepID=UPI0006852C1B|nr:hypothetical protein [Crocinitomix catalasitica]